MGRYFGTDGVRGKANVKLKPDMAFKIGAYLGWYYGKKNKARIVIGKDTRISCDMFENALAAGINSSGADAYLMHVTTTSSISYIAGADGFDCGIMISASHNPYYDNGIKLLNGQGEKMPESIILEVEDYIDGKKTIEDATEDKLGRTYEYQEGIDKYIKHLESIASHNFRGIKVGIDCANGSASGYAEELLSGLGADVTIINHEPDGVNINDNCGSTHMEDLCRLVKEKNLDVGFAYDGDADRCLAVDSEGHLVNGDGLLYAYGVYLKSEGQLRKNTIVTTVMSNYGLYMALDTVGINYEKTDVGDKYVYESMVRNSFSIGGEQSGHIIFSKYANTGDGMLTSILVMNMLVETHRTLKELTAGYKEFPQILKNVKVKNKESAQADEEVKVAVSSAEKSLNGTGRVLVRASGTEPLIRVMAEAEDEDSCRRCVDEIIKVLARQGHIA